MSDNVIDQTETLTYQEQAKSVQGHLDDVMREFELAMAELKKLEAHPDEPSTYLLRTALEAAEKNLEEAYALCDHIEL